MVSIASYLHGSFYKAIFLMNQIEVQASPNGRGTVHLTFMNKNRMTTEYHLLGMMVE